MSVQFRPGDLAFYLGLEPRVVMEVQRKFVGDDDITVVYEDGSRETVEASYLEPSQTGGVYGTQQQLRQPNRRHPGARGLSTGQGCQ